MDLCESLLLVRLSPRLSEDDNTFFLATSEIFLLSSELLLTSSEFFLELEGVLFVVDDKDEVVDDSIDLRSQGGGG